MLIFLIAIGILLQPQSATAKRVIQEKELLTDPGPSIAALYLTPNTTTPPIFHNQLYGPIGVGNRSFMHLTQWDTPDQLPVATSRGGNGPCQWPQLVRGAPRPLWWSNSTAGHVCAYQIPTSASVHFEIHQDGTKNLTCGNEFDSFLEPNGPGYPGVPEGFIQSPPFNILNFLNVSFRATVFNYSTVSQRCGQSPQCGGSGKVDYAYAVLGVVASTGPQTLFYQVALGDTRDNNGCPGLLDNCKPHPQFWYFDTNPYGVNDTPANFGYPCLGLSSSGTGIVGREVYYNLNILPRFLLSFKNAPAGMDTDPSHWHVNGVYLGIGMEGAVKNTILIQDWSVVVG